MDRRTDILKSLEQGLDASIDFFRSLTPDQLKTRVYADSGQWTTRQLLAHFVTIEQSMHWLFNDLLAGGEGAPADFDLDRFNQRQVSKLDPLTLDDLIDRYRVVRGATIEIVGRMTDADLDRQGRHTFLGQGTLERFVRWAYEHVRLHEADIRKALQA